MDESTRNHRQIRCAFNGFCKQTLRNEARNAGRDIERQQLKTVSFSSLTPQEENQLYTYDTYFANDEAEKTFCIAGKEITPNLLAETLHSLPEEKRDAVLLYYFFDLNDAEIAKLRDVPRSTIQYRRTSSFDLLKSILKNVPMTTQSKNSEKDESGLLPYPIIVAAVKGNPDAMNIVVQHYESQMIFLSMRKLRDERGNTYYGIDEDIHDRLRLKLIRAVLSFKF